MTSERPYKKAMTIEEALIELEINKGIQFDSQIVETTIACIRKSMNQTVFND